MNKKYILFSLLLLFVLLIKITSGFDRSEYVKLIYTYNGLTEPFSLYEICNPTNSNYYINDINDFNVDFYGNKDYLDDWGIKLGINKSEKVPVYDKICSPFVSEILPNGSWIIDDNCIKYIDSYYIKDKWEYVHYNMIGTSLSPKECRRIKVWGKRSPEYKTKIDNVITFNNIKFNEYDWWNLSCNNRTSIQMIPVITDANQQIFINMTKDIDWSKAYVVLNATNTELPFLNITQRAIWTNTSVIGGTPFGIEIYYDCSASRYAYNYTQVMLGTSRFETQAEIDAITNGTSGTWTVNKTHFYEGIGSGTASANPGAENLKRVGLIEEDRNISIVGIAYNDIYNQQSANSFQMRLLFGSTPVKPILDIGKSTIASKTHWSYRNGTGAYLPSNATQENGWVKFRFDVNSTGVYGFINDVFVASNTTSRFANMVQYYYLSVNDTEFDIIYWYRNRWKDNPEVIIGTEEVIADTTPPVIIFLSQIPSDINELNVMSKDVEINYSITDVSGVNLSNVTLFFKSNCTNNDISSYTNGSSIFGWRYFTDITNISDIFISLLNEEFVYPATYNFNETLAKGYFHSAYDLDLNTEYIKIEILNVSNKENSSFLEVYIDNQTAITSTARFYYCNSSYTTGNVLLSDDCTNFFNLEASEVFNHSHSGGNVFDHIIPFSVDISTGQIGGVYVTNTSQFLIRGRPINAWNIYYIDNVSRLDAVQTTQNSGSSWSNFAGTVRMHLHQFDGTDVFRYFMCAEDTVENSDCSTHRSDILEPIPLPPTSPDVFNPNGSTVSGIIDINYTASLSTSGARLLFYNITLLNTSFAFINLIEYNNSLNLSLKWNTSEVADNTYIIRVNVIDYNGFSSFGDSEEFIIDNINLPPNCTTIPTQSWEINNNQTINISLFCNDAENEVLNYTILNVTNITVTIRQNISILKFAPDINFTGTRNYNFNVSDGTTSIITNTFLLNITEVIIEEPITIAGAILRINGTVILIILLVLFFVMLVFSEIYGGLYYLATAFIGIGVYMYLVRFVDTFISLPFLLFVIVVAIRMVFKWEKAK